MNDLAELFPGVDLGSAPLNGGAQAPIGRRRGLRPQPALRRYRPPSATLMLLAQLRWQLDEGLTGLGQTLKRIESDFAGSVEILGELAESINHMRVRLTALERHAGIRPAPEVSRHSRRRPLS
jgi:hypothetical protein